MEAPEDVIFKVSTVNINFTQLSQHLKFSKNILVHIICL